MSAVEQKLCGCGDKIPQFWKMCHRCLDQKTIDDAEKVGPDTPLMIVGTDNFFDCLDEAGKEFAGEWAHPCFTEPLRVDPKRTAAMLAEQATEWMCEEAFEDAYSHVNGEKKLAAAIEAALVIFNDAQTASSWLPDTKKVFQIPALTERSKATGGEGA